MQVEISPEAAATIAQWLSRGMYADASEAVEEAVWRLKEADAAYVARLNEMIDEAVASLDAHGGTPWTPDLADRIIADGLKRRAARQRYSA